MIVKLFSFDKSNTLIHRLSGLTKLICFILLTTAVMLTYDIRVLFVIFVFAMAMVKVSKISFKAIKPMLIYVLIFLVFNFILTFLFAPNYGPELYGTSHLIFHILIL